MFKLDCFIRRFKHICYFSGARLLRCVRCPTAYHVGEFCIGAGSLNLPGYNIVCPKHFKPSKSNKAVHSHVNVSWCFSCNNGKSDNQKSNQHV